ncbi:MAG: hypothetical protein M0R77_18540 [Gammaproteobacteria bacterium]|nr:hypothetical protein [Gammaproteobacteria bacterium]
MIPVYNVNGLPFWSQEDIKLRNYLKDHFASKVFGILEQENPAWKMLEIEAPLLTPVSLINPNYTNEDVWMQERMDNEINHLVLRPETTPGSYAYAKHLLESHSIYKPPFIVWQAGKSFRREQDQVSKNMRLKEFYQQEFQCIYTADTMNDYHTAVLDPIKDMLADACNLSARVIASDRLPSYSEITMDVEVFNGDKYMEVCSISRRTDFPTKARFQTKKGLVEKDLMVLEIAIGLDRVIYNRNHIDRSRPF